MSSRDDLQKFDEAFASAPKEDKFESVPDGRYQVVVDRVELKETKATGQPMLSWELVITGPTHENRRIYKNSVITEKSIPYLKRDLVKCGIELERVSDLPDHLEQLLDLRLNVHKKTSGDYENVYFGSVVDGDATPVDPSNSFPNEKLPF